MTPDQYCQTKTRQSGSSFSFSFLFLDESQRRAMNALYAFCREVDDIVDECHDHNIAQTKLNWWKNEINQLFIGRPQHPVGQALLPLLAAYPLKEQHMLDVIDGMEMDLSKTRYETFSELEQYCYRAAGVVGLLSTEIFTYQHPATSEYAVELGLALQLTNILRDVKEDAERNRIYLPLDELRQFAVTEQDILNGTDSEQTRQLFAHQAKRAQHYYQSAISKLPEEDRYAQRSALIMAEIYHQLLEQIIQQNYPVLKRRVSLSPWKKLWLAWRTARREQKRHNQRRKHTA
ncbi:MAG: presqualene diphosphate synthase HpnD [Gammaproteobacteria bacterium]|nr:presqualene diphosphate synthase HpnD [Gammaproteobacteria bacterium]